MADEKKILVGVDPLQVVQGGETQFLPPLEQAIDQAIWLAEKTPAQITFLAAVELSDAETHSLAGAEVDVMRRLEWLGKTVLQAVVERAARNGVTAKTQIVTGKAWLEITREAVRGGYDMVLIGTRGMGAIGRMIFGSTAMKLLQNCPCPVWVARPETQVVPTSILAASDFSEVSDTVLRLALRIGSLAGANVSLLHVFGSAFARLSAAGLIETELEETHHAHDLARTRSRLEEQLARVTGGRPPAGVKMELVEGVGGADAYILDYLKAQEVDLLVMGTMARGGIPGVFIGNTAERLVHQIDCSLLAVKPADFQCQV
jgi:nucleotide-binding universal stress UspA family protein